MACGMVIDMEDYKEIIKQLKLVEFGLRINGLKNCRIVCKNAHNAIENLLVERDAAIAMLRGECSACKHNAGWHNIGKCATCKHENAGTFLPQDCEKHRNDKWEWRGLRESGGPYAEK